MSELVNKILNEGSYVLPSTIKKLKVEQWKDLDVNTIFKHNFIQKYRNIWLKMQEQYYKNGGRKKYGGDFSKTGVERKLVNINDIYPGQNGISSEGLLIKMNGEDNYKPSSELPEGLLLSVGEGKRIILLTDGHHRVAEDILKGKIEVELNLKVAKFS